MGKKIFTKKSGLILEDMWGELSLKGYAEGGEDLSESKAKSTTRNLQPILPVKARKQENLQHNESDHCEPEPRRENYAFEKNMAKERTMAVLIALFSGELKNLYIRSIQW